MQDDIKVPILSLVKVPFTLSSGSPFRGSDAEERLIDHLLSILFRQGVVTEQEPEIQRRNNRIE